jgi:hypothetical protein
VADSSSATARSVAAGDDVALDLNTTPRAELRFYGSQSSFNLGYSPSFAWLDVTRDGELAILHSANAVFAWSTRRLRLSLGVTGSIGRQSFLALTQSPVTAPTTSDTAPPPTTGAPADGSDTPAPTSASPFFPQQEIVYTGSLSGWLGMSYELSRRWSISSRIGYEVSGGLGDSEQSIPLRRGPTADASAGYRWTRRDTLTTSLAAAQIVVPSRGSRFTSISALEDWSHRFARRTQGNVGAGATYLRSRDTGNSEADNSLLASGVIGFTQGWLVERDALVAFIARGALGTEYNPVLGVVNQRVNGEAGLSWTNGPASVACSGQVSQSLPLDALDAALAYGASVTGGYQLADPVALSIGGGWTHQVLPSQVVVTTISPDQWRAFVALSLVAPVLVL